MRLIILVCQLGLILRTNAQLPPACSSSDTNRPPENSDMTVICGTTHIEVNIYICPVYNSLYNESLMVLNNQASKPECFGKADWAATPPLLKFKFPINQSSSFDCNNDIKVTSQVGTGEFSMYSLVEAVNISGLITSIDPVGGQITYREMILYKFSCFYPMLYLINNTEMAVSGVNLAIRDKNGTFITTLSMSLYKDNQYSEVLDIPKKGLDIKTKIYVAVKATNLTERFNVLLDRCYATTAPIPSKSNSYDLFVGCVTDPQTVIEVNGKKQVAYFSFEAFRFVEHKNKTVSVFYLHCATRLCEVSKCSSILPSCSTPLPGRRKREVPDDDEPINATVSSGPIIVGKQSIGEAQSFSVAQETSQESNYSGPVVAIIVCLAFIAIFITGLTVYLVLFIRQRKTDFS